VFTAPVNGTVGKANFVPGSLGLISGVYAIKAVFHPADYPTSDLSHDVEDIKGWIGIENLVIVSPASPPAATIQVDKSDPNSKVRFAFSIG